MNSFTHARCFALLMSLLLAIAACGPLSSPPPGNTTRLITLPALCDGSRYQLEITPDLATIQEQSNTLIAHQQALYIVESGANAISRFEPDTQKLTPNLIDVGNNQNPYDIFIDEDGELALITNYLGGSVTAANPRTGEVLAEFGKGRLISPSGIAATPTHVYVSDVEFGRGDNGFGPGAVHVFERGSWTWIGEIATARQNPHYITLLSDVPSPTLLITNVGAVGFDEGRYRQLSDGAIERWEIGGDPLSPRVTIAEIPTPDEPGRDGAPGRPMRSSKSRLVHMVSATAPVMLTLDVETMQWVHGPEDPLLLYSSELDTLHAGEVMPDGLVLILSYNQDALYVVDPACDRVVAGPVDLGTSSQDLEGPLAIVAHSEQEAYFMMSLSKRLGKIAITPQP